MEDKKAVDWENPYLYHPTGKEKRRIRGTWEQEAHDHWETYLPKYYKSLKDQGILEETLERAAEQAGEMIGSLTSISSDNPLHEHEAREIVWPQFILLPPEEDLPEEVEPPLTQEERDWEPDENTDSSQPEPWTAPDTAHIAYMVRMIKEQEERKKQERLQVAAAAKNTAAAKTGEEPWADGDDGDILDAIYGGGDDGDILDEDDDLVEACFGHLAGYRVGKPIQKI